MSSDHPISVMKDPKYVVSVYDEDDHPKKTTKTKNKQNKQTKFNI
jgi:hypothetical protein